jgi:hypothetical protein
MNRKGQSAIEYLMTYGWMLLVVAIVGGAIYTTVGERCVTSTSGFSSTDVRISDFGRTSSGELRFDLRNANGEPIQVTNISVTSEEGQIAYSENDTNIAALEKSISSVSNVYFRESSSCNNMDVKITYDKTDGISNQTVEGQITDTISLGASSVPASPSDLTISY